MSRPRSKPSPRRSGKLSRLGDFSVSGREDDIGFYIKDPFGGLVYGVIRTVGGQSFTAEARYSGTHTLYFDNSFSWGTSRQVALRYHLR